jgi:hypothetical protein
VKPNRRSVLGFEKISLTTAKRVTHKTPVLGSSRERRCAIRYLSSTKTILRRPRNRVMKILASA